MTSPEKRPLTNHEHFDEEISPDIADFSLNKDSAEGPAETKKTRKRKSRLKDPLLSKEASKGIKEALNELDAHYEGVPVNTDELLEREKEQPKAEDYKKQQDVQSEQFDYQDQVTEKDVISEYEQEQPNNEVYKAQKDIQSEQFDYQEQVAKKDEIKKQDSSAQKIKNNVVESSKNNNNNNSEVKKESKYAKLSTKELIDYHPGDGLTNSLERLDEIQRRLTIEDKKDQGEQESEIKEVLSSSEIKFCQDTAKFCFSLDKRNKKRQDIFANLPFILRSGNDNLQKQEIQDFISFSLYNMRDSVRDHKESVKANEKIGVEFKKNIEDYSGHKADLSDDTFDRFDNMITSILNKLNGMDRSAIIEKNTDYKKNLKEALRESAVRSIYQTETSTELRKIRKEINRAKMEIKDLGINPIKRAYKESYKSVEHTTIEKAGDAIVKYFLRPVGIGLGTALMLFFNFIPDMMRFMGRAVNDLMSNKFPQDVLNMMKNAGDKINYWLNPEQDPANKSKDKDK